MTKIKICGIRRKEDALFAASLGAAFVGFIFAPESPRYIDPLFAGEIIDRVKGLINAPKIVGVFRNEKPDNVRAIAETLALDFVQLQGNESDEVIREIGFPAIKAIHVADTVPPTDTHPSAQWLLFDTFDPKQGGGTGRQFDWALLAGHHGGKPFLLAGGLNAQNVGAAIRALRPDGIDVASGVESAPGIKDQRKLERFFDSVRTA